MEDQAIKSAIKSAILAKRKTKVKDLLEEYRFHDELTDESEEQGNIDESIMPHMVLHDLFELAVEQSSDSVADLLRDQLDEYIDMRLDYYSYTLLHHYAYVQNESMMRHLIKKGYDINAGFYEEHNYITFSGSILTEAIRSDPESPILSFIIYHTKFTNMQEGGYQRNSESAFEGLNVSNEIYPLEELFDTVYRDTLYKKGARLINLTYLDDGSYYSGSLLSVALLGYQKVGDIDYRRVETLLYYGADASGWMDDDLSPLEFLSYGCAPTEHFTLDKKISLIRLFIGYGASLEDWDENYFQRLVWNDEAKLARYLLNLNDSDEFILPSTEGVIDNPQLTPKEKCLNQMMEKALIERNADVVSFLLQQGVDPTARCLAENDKSFIHKAIEIGDFNCFKALLDSGRVDVNGKYEPEGLRVTPIILAARVGRIDMMDYLIRLGAKLHSDMSPRDDSDIIDLDGEYVSPLIAALCFNHVGAAGYLLSRDIEISHALYDIALFGQKLTASEEFVTWLLANGASLKDDAEEYYSPVECAVLSDNPGVLKIFLEKTNSHTLEKKELEGLIRFFYSNKEGYKHAGEILCLLEKTKQGYSQEYENPKESEPA